MVALKESLPSPDTRPDLIGIPIFEMPITEGLLRPQSLVKPFVVQESWTLGTIVAVRPYKVMDALLPHKRPVDAIRITGQCIFSNEYPQSLTIAHR